MSILDTIVEEKRREIALLPPGPIDVSGLRWALTRRGGARGFARALQAQGQQSVALIAEVKKASPSAGVIRPDFDAVRIAGEYQLAGASCLSVLTDEKFFQGSLGYLRQIRQAVGLPLLRKDFIIDERQIMEAIEWGADAILLIVSILNDDALKRFHDLAIGAGLDALVEVHDSEELKRALACGASLIGVNNRDLRTFKVDLATTENLAAQALAHAPRQTICLVSESGIHSHADVQRVQRAGVKAILVGESLMRERDITAKVSELLGGPILPQPSPV